MIETWPVLQVMLAEALTSGALSAPAVAVLSYLVQAANEVDELTCTEALSFAPRSPNEHSSSWLPEAPLIEQLPGPE